jgi:hypothetical protein
MIFISPKGKKANVIRGKVWQGLRLCWKSPKGKKANVIRGKVRKTLGFLI